MSEKIKKGFRIINYIVGQEGVEPSSAMRATF